MSDIKVKVSSVEETTITAQIGGAQKTIRLRDARLIDPLSFPDFEFNEHLDSIIDVLVAMRDIQLEYKKNKKKS